jgi:hypothetical protein
MKFDPKKLNALSVRLHGKQIGVMNRFAGDRQIFAFEQDYIDDPQRPTLSLRSRAALAGSFRPCADRRQSPRRNTFALRIRESLRGYRASQLDLRGIRAVRVKLVKRDRETPTNTTARPHFRS